MQIHTHKTTQNFTVGEEDCDGLCPDIRVRGDLGNHQFRLIVMTKISIQLKMMTLMLTLMFLMTMMAVCFCKLYNHVRFTMGGRSIAQVAIS